MGSHVSLNVLLNIGFGSIDLNGPFQGYVPRVTFQFKFMNP